MTSKKDPYEFRTARSMREVKKLMKKGWDTAESSGSESWFWGSNYKALMRRPNPKYKQPIPASR